MGPGFGGPEAVVLLWDRDELTVEDVAGGLGEAEEVGGFAVMVLGGGAWGGRRMGDAGVGGVEEEEEESKSGDGDGST